MNFVAHQYLSFNNSEIQIGNLLGEVVRGKNYLKYDKEKQKGILLHRQIDTFTDSHPVVKQSSARFHENYGKYSPVIVDILYDYLLIKNWALFSKQDYEGFVDDCYDLFMRYSPRFPNDLQKMLEYLIKYDWFRNYASLEGIEKTLRGLSKRTKFPNDMKSAVKEIYLHENKFEEEFLLFFPDLKNFCLDFLENSSEDII